MDIFAQQLINGLVLGSIYALVALGYTMVYGILGLINFAHGDITMVGALVSLTILQALAAAGDQQAAGWVRAAGAAHSATHRRIDHGWNRTRSISIHAWPAVSAATSSR